MKKAIIQKTKNYKFGLSLKKGEVVNIQETIIDDETIYSAFKEGDNTLGFGVTSNDFEYRTDKTFRVTYRMERYYSAETLEEAREKFDSDDLNEFSLNAAFVELTSIDVE